MDADESIRFHIDENVDVAIARALRAHGLDVTTAGDAGLLGATDEAHLRFAARESRVIYTQDSDFLRLHHAGEQHGGIVYCAPGSMSVGDQVRGLILVASCLDRGEFANHMEFL